MSGYWLRVESGLIDVVRSSDMDGHEPKWLAVCCKKLTCLKLF